MGRARRNRTLIALATMAAAAGAGSTPSTAGARSLARYVNPLVGSRGAPRDFNPGGTFPGATLPFGMVQWSPDTERPSSKVTAKYFRGDRPGPRFGYDYGGHRVAGFSLTHLSGAGCPAYGDFPFMPTTARIAGAPALPGSSSLRPRYAAALDHRHERARPGYYAVRLNRGRPSAIAAELTATTRTGFGRFTYPRHRRATMLINAGGSAANDRSASVSIDPGAHEVSGSASSGRFCVQRNRYRVYFVARFDRRFRRYGTWRRRSLRPGSTAAADSVSGGITNASQAGAYVTLAGSGRTVEARVGISFVSVADARRNLDAESSGRSFAQTRRAARGRWNRALGAIRVGGGTLRDRRTFYTALYHSLLAPRTFSDDDGRYPGMDGRIHTAGHYTQYADFSGWDVYRSEIPLLAMIDPGRASDIVRSLLADAAQSGCLPKWPIADGQTMEMVGDPADAMIASAAAFGAGAFSHATALHAMLKGATSACQSANASYLERQGLAPYESLGYIPFELNVQKGNATSAVGSPSAVWGTAATTLEYETADFAIAQFAARFSGNRSAYAAMMRRSGGWRKLVDPRTRYIEARRQGGGFASNSPTSNSGFAEGSAAQYTWMVPFDPAGLAAKLGGRGRAVSRLRRFLADLNDVKRGFHSPHALLGNEPSLGAPWLFDWLRRPYRTQATVRRALTSLFGPGPAGEPGQDDLGELSSWYVLGALGLYPETPGVGLLAVSTPLFPRARVHLGGGGLALDAPRASPARRYVHGLRLDGRHYGKPWIPYCALAGGARLRFGLSGRPDRSWGATAADRPPSFGPGAPRPGGPCSVPRGARGG